MKATGTLKPVKWDEKTYDQITADKKLTKATVEHAFSGEIVGKASVEFLMYYKHADETNPHHALATFIGMMRFEGTLNGKSGSFVMSDFGTFISGALDSKLTVLPDSGTGELEGIAGNAKYHSNASEVAFEIEYELSAEA